jgi:polysaccharide pyruvyl transferase WcaK-like protein
VRYFLYGYYGYGNFGDDLLLRALVDGISRRDADAQFLVHSFDTAPGFEGEPRVRFVPLARRLENVGARPWRVLHYLAGFASSMGASDTLVIGGGALFTDKGRFSLSLALLYAMTLYARFLDRRIVLVGVAVDRLELAVDRWLTRRIFAAASFIAVREAPSLKFAPSGADARLAADLALGLDWGDIPPAPAHTRPVVGLSFIDYYRTLDPSAERHAAYEAAVHGLVERHRATHDFVLVVLQQGRGQRDDWLAPVLRSRYGIPAIELSDLASARSLAPAIDLLVTTRFHLGLLGALWGKPVIVIDHEAKMEWLGATLALPVMRIGDFIAAGGLDLEALAVRYDARRTRARFEAERARVGVNFAWLAA